MPGAAALIVGLVVAIADGDILTVLNEVRCTGGFVSEMLRKKLGLAIISEKHADGERAYRTV